MENKKTLTPEQLLPEALEINQLMQELPPHTRENIVKIARLMADAMYEQMAERNN